MKTTTFDYHLPPELIAQRPASPRDSSRLMVLPPEAGEGARLEHRLFRDLGAYLRPGDLLVLNRTRVIRARLLGRRAVTGGRAEVLLLRPAPGVGPDTPEAWGEAAVWETLVRPGRRLGPGAEVVFHGGREAATEPRLVGRILKRTAAGGRIIAFRVARPNESFDEAVEGLGHVPLPPYITEPLDDPERYQTVYASVRGSAAAPTAGLHFTRELLERLAAAGVEKAWVTLHIGLDTFRPVREEEVEAHPMHSEWYEVPPETARAVAACRERGGRVVAGGTTVVRSLESAADPGTGGLVRAGRGETTLFIYPGYRFRVVDLLLTNFHLPRSTLLMLVSAFGGTQRVLSAYEEAARLRYRFYSFGDAMLIFPAGAGGEAGP